MKLSFTHSSILEHAGDAEYAAMHTLHLAKIARLLEHYADTAIEISSINVTVHMSIEKFQLLFDTAEDMLEQFYGKINCKNEVLRKFIDHCEHHHHNHESNGS
jgi:hypothetical protein